MNQQRHALGAAPLYQKGDDIPALMGRAIAFHQSGRLVEAQAGYKKILKKRPNHFDALRLLGMSEHQRGDIESAVRLLKRALLVNQQSTETWCALGAALTAQHRLEEAVACYDSLLGLQPDFLDGHLTRGDLLSRLKRLDEAVASYDKVIAVHPQHAGALMRKGEALHYLGKFTEALGCYDSMLAIKPDHVPAIIDRGAAFKDLRQLENAIVEFDRALAIEPNHTTAWLNRGEALLTLNRRDEALASFDKVLSIDPRHALAWLGRANILMLTSRVMESLTACRHALGIEPNSAKALTQLGMGHALLGEADTALGYFDRALAIEPNLEYALSAKIFIEDFKDDGDFTFHQASRSEWWKRIGSKLHNDRSSHHANDRNPARRLVVGYVSAEFRKRSAAYTFRPVLQNHDKTRFEVICYSGSQTEDDVTASFRQIADQWRNVLQWSDDQLVDCIRKDKVDILVDLSGHTDGNRLRVFARKPAPIQVTAWGYANGTGVPTIDYLFSDPVMVPPEARHLFAEQICDLPCAIVLEPPQTALRSAEPPVLTNGNVTYGVFNRVSKISTAAIALWARILRSDTTSRLLIKDHQIDDSATRDMLLGKFASEGITPDRIQLMGSTSRDEHLATYSQVDICLDPFPHGGGVSTWESLYMGVPVVTKLGNGATSRVAAAILSATGLGDWVATSDDQYVDIALQPAAARLGAVRRDLPDMIEQRCGPVAYARAVEQAYAAMWQKYCGAAQG